MKDIMEERGKVIQLPGAIDWRTIADDQIPVEPWPMREFLESTRARSKSYAGGKIDLDWVLRCGQAHPFALHLALAIRARGRLHKDGFVPAGNALGRRVGLSRDTRRRALAALEEAGLVKVNHRDGKVPLAALIDCDETPEPS